MAAALRCVHMCTAAAQLLPKPFSCTPHCSRELEAAQDVADMQKDSPYVLQHLEAPVGVTGQGSTAMSLHAR